MLVELGHHSSLHPFPTLNPHWGRLAEPYPPRMEQTFWTSGLKVLQHLGMGEGGREEGGRREGGREREDEGKK